MDISVALAFDEPAAVRLLNWLAGENERIFRVYDQRSALRGEAPLPGLYESGVRYEREETEVWSDYLNLLIARVEDCDALSAARAGELRARGYRAMAPKDPKDPVRYPGDAGYREAQRLRPKSIDARVVLSTHTDPGRPGLYHCIVKYVVGGKTYYDDPSARLGMLGDPDAPEVRQGLATRDLTGQPRAGAREVAVGRSMESFSGLREDTEGRLWRGALRVGALPDRGDRDDGSRR